MLKRRRDQWKFCRVAKICNLKILYVANFYNLRIFATFAGCEISQPSQVAKFRNLRRLRNFATLLPPTADCFLTRLFVVLYKFTLDVILVHLHSFEISLY